MTSRAAAILVHETMKLQPFWCTERIPVGINVGDLFSRKTFLSLQDICIASDHASENDLLAHIPKNSLNSELTYLTIF